MEPRAAVKKGYLLLVDISGYTAFLTQSELEHAQDILRCLFQALLGDVRPPLVVCELEGDAIFAYAPEGSFLQGQTLVQVVENLYCTFAASREQMQRNTTCTCTACRLIPQLDLKFVAHHGAFVLQQVDRRHAAKPSGTDVILVHRLLKNRIQEATGVEAYAFFSASCAQALKLDALVQDMRPHTEQYEHLGAVSGYVHDLQPIWGREREQRRVQVSPDEAWFTIEADLPVPPPLVWDYFTEPDYSRRWREADSLKITGTTGRAGVGTQVHCAHGNMTVIEQILDWRPFDYYTSECLWPMRASARYTSRLMPTAHGTHVACSVGRPEGRNAVHTAFVRLFYAFMKKSLARDYAKGLANMQRLIEADQATGKVPVVFELEPVPA